MATITPPLRTTAPEAEAPPGEARSGAWTPERQAALAAPFEAGQIERLPKALKREDQDKGRCGEDTKYCADEHPCGGWHVRSIHLSYVGHAGVTDRLNSVDPFWNWEPMAVTPTGTPHFSDGGLWIKLTVLGVTRYGFGDAGRKAGPDAVKEIIGDALRNAAMRFGVGTYLWSRSADAQLLQAGGETAGEAGQQGRPERQESQRRTQETPRAPRPVHNVQRLHAAFQPLTSEQRSWLFRFTQERLGRPDVEPENLSDLEAALVCQWAAMLANGEDPREHARETTPTASQGEIDPPS